LEEDFETQTKKAKMNQEDQLGTADDVREYVLVVYIKPARRRGAKSAKFTAMEIHKGMGLRDRFSLVCSAIDAVEFLSYASVNLVNREGPSESNTVRWTFDLGAK
jgi:hypothetical protein